LRAAGDPQDFLIDPLQVIEAAPRAGLLAHRCGAAPAKLEDWPAGAPAAWTYWMEVHDRTGWRRCAAEATAPCCWHQQPQHCALRDPAETTLELLR